MTRKFNAYVHCQCGRRVSLETPLSRWMRDHLIDSKLGLVISDVDYLVHRFKSNESGRMKQWIMQVECKVAGADLDESQHETLAFYYQMICNVAARKSGSNGRFIRGGDTLARKLKSPLSNRPVIVLHLGYHLLQLSGDSPENSQEILWNRKPINYQRLVQLMQLEIHPLTFKPLDARRHKAEKPRPLFD